MQVHDLIFIAKLLSKLEEQAHLERAVLEALFCLGLGLFVLSEGIQTASFVYMDLLILFTAFHEFVVDTHGLTLEERKRNRQVRVEVKKTHGFQILKTYA